MSERHDGLVLAGLDVVVDEGDECCVTTGNIICTYRVGDMYIQSSEICHPFIMLYFKKVFAKLKFYEYLYCIFF